MQQTTEIQQRAAAAATAVPVVREHRRRQRRWRRLDQINASQNLRDPAWKELFASSKQVISALADTTPHSESLEGANADFVRLATFHFGIAEGQANELTLEQHQNICAALDTIESELRVLASEPADSSIDVDTTTQLPPSVRRAGESYEWVCEQRPNLIPTMGRRAWYCLSQYKHVREYNCPAYRDHPVPSYDTWCRQLRTWQQHRHAQHRSTEKALGGFLADIREKHLSSDSR